MLAEQRTLWDCIEAPSRGRPTLDERFREFHRNNPHVFAAIVREAHAERARGHKRLSMKRIFEELRYQAETAGETWQLNNSYTSRYVDLVTETVPELAGMFETRERKAA